MGKGSAAIQAGGVLPVVGSGGSLMIHSAGSVTIQSIALAYVMASEPYMYTWYLKLAGLPYCKIYLYCTCTYTIESNMFSNLT